MKLLILLTDLFDAVGGIQTYNRCLVKALDNFSLQGDHEIIIFVLNDKGKNPIVKDYIKSKYLIYKGFKGNKLDFVLTTFFARCTFDLIIVGHINFSPIVWLINDKKRKSSKYLIVFGLEGWNRLPFIQRLSINRMDKIIAISKYTQEQIRKYNNILPHKLNILNCCLDPLYSFENALHDRQELNLPSGRMILSVSRLHKYDNLKNIDLMIKAMPSILREIPDAFYVIVGDGSDSTRLRQIAKNLNLGEKVIFTGPVSGTILPSYYNSCDVFVLPSLLEGFGIVFLEAMLYAKPVVGANANAIPEVVEDGVTGILAQPGDLKSLSESIIHILKNKNLGRIMGLAGKERLQKAFSFQSFCSKLELILKV